MYTSPSTVFTTSSFTGALEISSKRRNSPATGIIVLKTRTIAMTLIATAISIYGFTMAYKIKLPSITDIILTDCKAYRGNWSSIKPTSFENFVNTRPDGFSSKNRNGVQIIVMSMLLCRFRLETKSKSANTLSR
jgi:hypothetical protein